MKLVYKLYHWETNGYNFLLISDSEDSARKTLIANVKLWQWQDPEVFTRVLKDLELPPLFSTYANHVIVITENELKEKL